MTRQEGLKGRGRASKAALGNKINTLNKKNRISCCNSFQII
jgi:hypothetical protein